MAARTRIRQVVKVEGDKVTFGGEELNPQIPMAGDDRSQFSTLNLRTALFGKTDGTLVPCRPLPVQR
jgi:hypothetical protein